MIRIAIADDHAGIRLSLSRFLARQPGMAVVGVAENGAKALELVESTRPDILVLDIHMPEKNGIEVACALQECSFAPRIIMISHYISPALIDTLFELGVQAYLPKEEGMDHLPEAIRTVFQESLS